MTPEEVRRALKEGKTPASVLAEMRGKGTPASEKPADVSPVEAPKDTGTPETPAVPHDPETRFRQRRSSRPPPPVGPHATRASSLDARGREADAEANLRDLRDPQAAYQKQREREHADAAASALPAKPSVAQRAARGALEVASLGMGSDEFKDRLASGKTWTEDVKPVVALAGVGIAHGLKNTASGRLAGTLLEEPVDTFAADTAAEIQTRAAREREAAQRKEKNPDYILSQHIAEGLFSGPMPKDRRKANQELHTRLIESKMAAWQAAHPGATQGEVDAKRPEMAKAATADMIQLSKEGQWFWEVTPDDLQREDPSWPQVLFEPKQSFTAEGDIAQSESVPMWALDLIGKTDYLATTAAEEVVPSLREKGKENAGFKERLKSNLWNRRDLVTATIESDPQIQADLASGDGGRIADAEKKLIVPLVLSMLTPDTLTPLGYAKRANQIRKLGVLKAFDTARTAAAPARPLQKVRVAMEALDKVEAEMKAAARVEENAKRVARARAVFEETGNVDQALAQIGKAGDLPQWLSGDPEGWVATTADAFRNKPNAALARYLKEEATAIAAADPEVAAYLEHLQDPAKVLDEDAQAIVDAGRAKFPEAERAAMRQALDEVQALSKGESRTRTVRKVTVTDEPSVATKGVEEKIGKRVTPERARRIADASTPAELREALAGMPAEVYGATARRLGFGDDVEEFKAALRTDPGAVNDALRMTRAEALDAENKVREALDREAALNAAPEQIADIARKRAAMKAAEKEAKEAEKDLRKYDDIEPPKAEPPKAEPPKAEPPKAEPPKAEPPKAEPPKAEPPKAEPPKAEPPKAEPPKAEPPKAEPPKAEPPKAPVDPVRPVRVLSDVEEAVENEKALEGVTNAREALDVLLRGDHVPRDYKIIAARIRESVHPETKIVLVAPGDKAPNGMRGAKGSFWSGPGNPGTIYLKRGVFGQDHGVGTDTILHELLHAATMQKLRIGNMTPNANTPVGKATKALYDLQHQVAKHFNDISRKTPGLEDPERAYQISSVDELISYGFTDRKFQDFLRTIPSQRKDRVTTLWSDFVEDILALLGIPETERSVLDDLLDLTDKFLDAPMEKDYRLSSKTEGVASKAATPNMTPLIKARDAYAKELDALDAARKAADERDGFKMPRWLDEQYAKIVRDEELLAGKTLSAEKRAVEEKKIAARYAAYDEAEQKAFNEFDTRMAAKEDVAQKRVDAAKAAFDKEVQKARTAQEAHAAARADAEEKLAAARKKVAEATDAYNTAAAKKPPTVRQGNAGIVQAENAQKAIAQKRKALEDLRTKEADLQRALERHGQVQDRVIADRPDMQNIADAYVAQGPIKTEQVVTEEVYELGSDPQLLVDALDRIDRMRRTIEPKSFKTASFFQRTFQVPSQIKALFYDHWGDVEGRSLAPHVRAAMRRLDGAMDDVGRRLSAGVRAADETATDVNKAAFQDILAETVSFKDGLISKRMPSEFVWSIVYAYAGNRSLSEGDVRRLVRLVSDWSITDESAEMLANRVYDTMLDINGGTPAGLNPRQIGDVNVAIGLGKGGASAEVQRTMGFGLSKNDADAAAQWVSSFSRGAPMSPRAAEGRRAVVEHILRPDAYVPPNTKPFKAWNDKSTPYHGTRPYVEAYTRKGIDEVALKSLAQGREDFEKVMDEVFGASEQEFYVPHAVRDVWTRHTDAAVNTVRLSNQMDANLEGMFNWWKQAAILGIGVSNPRQSILDYTGDLLQILTTPGGGAVLAAKTAVRSLGAQVVNIPFVAQGMTLVDVVRGVERGTAVKAFDRVVGDISCGKGVNSILSRTQDVVGSTGKTGAELYRIATDHGIIENLITSQVGQAMRRHLPSSVPVALRATVSAAGGGVAGLAVGGLPGALVGATLGAMAGGTHLGRRAILANEDALYDAANVAATRRRLALFVGLLEEGREPNQAAELATRLVGDFSRELSPLEIQTIGRVMPFHAYRKFNMRRVFKALASPWWVESVRDGGEHVSMLLSALFDTDDEYGMQTNAMVDEPDPLAFGQIYDMLAEQDPSRDIQEVWKEAQWISDHGGFLVPTTYTGKDIPFDPETRRSLPLPRALARYERIKARLDAKPYRDALWDLALADDPEIKAYAMYFAPDPIKALAPAHLRDRWKVQLDKSRGQYMALYTEIGSRAGDPAMKNLLTVWPLTPDPNADGLLFPLLAVLTAGKIATLGGVKGSAPADLAQAMTREPVMQSIAAVFNLDPGSYAKPIPRSIGENLFRYLPNSWVKRTDALGNVVEPGTEDGTPRVYRYYLNPRVWSALQLMPGFSKYFIATLQAEKMRAAANGEVMGQKGPVDRVDRWNGWSQFLGQEFYTYDEGTVQYGAEQDRRERIDAASKTIGATQPVDVNAQ